MRILLSHRYFWPDGRPYGLMLRSIGADLAAAGHEVHVFSARPARRGAPAPRCERIDGMAVRRLPVLPEGRWLPVRAVNAMLYTLALALRILRLRPEVVMVASFPPVLAAWAAGLAARRVGARLLYHVQDIHPEVSAVSGGCLGRGLAFRLLRALDTATLRRAAAIVTLSEDMRATLRARPGCADLPVILRDNFDLASFGADPQPQPPGDGTRLRAIFAGNLGRFQALPALAGGVLHQAARDPRLELVFMGEGAALPELRARYGARPDVRFLPFLPFAQARPVIAAADIGLLSLAPGLHRVSCPSKLATYAGLGLPVLALVDPASALARRIEASGMGAVPRGPSPGAIAEALAWLTSDPARLAAARDAALRHHREHCGRDPALRHWRRIFAGLGREGAAEAPERAA